MKTLKTADLHEVSAGLGKGRIDAAELAQLKADWERYEKSGSLKDYTTYATHFGEALRD